jgi:hypothetical protein
MEIVWIALGLIVGIVQTRRFYKGKLERLQRNVEALEHQIATMEIYTVTSSSDDDYNWD